jgi:hypothetical protein
MENTHLPATRLNVHFANRDLGFSVCLPLPRGCGIGELRPPSPTQCAEALPETSAEVNVGRPVHGEFVVMQQLVFGISHGNVSANDNGLARRLSIPESRSAFLPSAPHDSGTRCNSL